MLQRLKIDFLRIQTVRRAGEQKDGRKVSERSSGIGHHPIVTQMRNISETDLFYHILLLGTGCSGVKQGIPKKGLLFATILEQYTCIRLSIYLTFSVFFQPIKFIFRKKEVFVQLEAQAAPPELFGDLRMRLTTQIRLHLYFQSGNIFLATCRKVIRKEKKVK